MNHQGSKLIFSVNILGFAMAFWMLSTSLIQAQSDFLDSRAEAIQAFLDDTFSEGNAGMVVGLVDEHGQRLFSAGVLDNGSNQSVNGDTIFEIGSITKTFTCLLMLDAVRRGELKLADPVSIYLPAEIRVPDWHGKPITLLNLASHDSGLPWWPPSRPKDRSLKQIKADGDRFTVADLYADLPNCQLERAPGAEFSYSNFAYALLGHVIEMVTGKDFDSLVSERIAKPLGMANTRVSLTPGQKLNRARGHWVDGTQSEHKNFQAMVPAGSLHSTAKDMLAFLAANLSIDDTPLTPLMKQMQSVRHETSKSFGKTSIGWNDAGVYNPPGTELWGHGGGGLGNLAFVGFDAEKQRGVVVLTNQMKTYPNGVGWTLLQGMPFTPANLSFAVRQVVGVGIALAKDEESGDVKITRVFQESPAGRAGLVAGGVLVKINDTPVRGKEMQECLQLIAGAAGTKIQLELRTPAGESQSIELTRATFLTTS